MTLTELRYIVAVAKEKHFGFASQICFVYQPTLKESEVLCIHRYEVVVR
jgi:DNA-binding transcriptional LysR family regulator